jgi:hypothetical protein
MGEKNLIMLISDLIKKLEFLQRRYGDVQIDPNEENEHESFEDLDGVLFPGELLLRFIHIKYEKF